MKASLLSLIGALAICVGALGAIGVTADGREQASVAPHRHFVQTPSGLVEVGPRACDDPATRAAFSRFHAKVHIQAGSPRPGSRVITRRCELTR